MSKKIKKKNILVLPDSTEKIEKFINFLMTDWKKLLAKKIIIW